ncbi:E3 ubiquitin-protein ligase TRIM11-like [Engystomops pustulosus]|uniref:E3 ubiquitin-protein ligase TRIM11-like n=1 Tax=Engystomops pustulosus TaxID=76066 RepID=UPI003AFA228A
MASSDLREELNCSICLSLYTDPVTLRCGHNFCRDCIDQHLTTQDWSGGYSCPDCRENFQDRPELRRNIALHNVAERLKSTEPHQEEVTGICCTYCVDSSVPVVKSCLNCEVFLCNNHLRVHSEGPEHILIEISTFLEHYKCSVHGEWLKYYCTMDATCICMSCHMFGEHRGHQAELLNMVFERKKTKLINVLPKLKNRIKKTEERIQRLEEQWRKAQEKASEESARVSALLKDSKGGLDGLRLRMKLLDLEKNIHSEIDRQEMEVSLSVSALIQKLETQKDELSRKMRHIEELWMLDAGLSDIHAMRRPKCPPKPPPLRQSLSAGYVVDDSMLEVIGGKVTAGGNRRIAQVDTLRDVNPANRCIQKFGNNEVAARHARVQPQLPQIAARSPQEISSKIFSSGRHYWEVEISDIGEWRVGMCYPSMERTGRYSRIGDNNKSWSWGRSLRRICLARHDSKVIRLPHQISSNRFRICLDYEAGELSFYELPEPEDHPSPVIPSVLALIVALKGQHKPPFSQG